MRRAGHYIAAFKVGGSGIHSFEKEHPSIIPEALEAGTANGHSIAGLSAAFDFLKETKVENIQKHESCLIRIFMNRWKKFPVLLYMEILKPKTGRQWFL